MDETPAPLHDLARFDLNLAVTFLALWQDRSVSRAAGRLSLSQSAVSAALARLRAAARDPLFVRMQGTMAPTPRAIAMAEGLLQGTLLIREAFRRGEGFDPASCRRGFAIGMSDDFQLAAGPWIAQAVARAAPEASVILRQTNSQRVERQFEAGELDLAVVAGLGPRPGLIRQEAGSAGYLCLLDRARAGVELPLTLEAYLELPHVLVSWSGREGIVDPALRAIGRTRRIGVALTHFAALPPFLLGARAVATLPAHAARSLARATGLVAVAAPVELGTFAVSVCSARNMQGDPAIAWIRGIVAEEVVRAIAEG